MTAPDKPDTLKPSTAPAAAETPVAETVNAADDTPVREDVEGTAQTEDALTTARREAKENYERYLRAIADLENFRRRAVREKDDLRQFATGRVLEDLLPVIDNLILAITAAKAPGAKVDNLVDGVVMVQEQLKSALSNHGLKEIDPLGQKFDPNQHEAIAMQPSAEAPEGVVLQVVRIGYSLNGRLLRPASVVVSSGPAKTEEKA